MYLLFVVVIIKNKKVGIAAARDLQVGGAYTRTQSGGHKNPALEKSCSRPALEKSSNYFCRLKKKRQENNSRNSLYVNGVINTSPKMISSEIFQFYSSLYSSSFSESDCNIFFKNIHSSIPQLDQETKDLCEADIKIEEVDKAINKLRSGKSPGPDDLTCEFYKYFREDLRELLFKAFFECIQDNCLSSTMKQG